MREWRKAIEQKDHAEFKKRKKLKPLTKVLIALLSVLITSIIFYFFFYEEPLQKEFLLENSDEYAIPIFAESVTAVEENTYEILGANFYPPSTDDESKPTMRLYIGPEDDFIESLENFEKLDFTFINSNKIKLNLDEDLIEEYNGKLSYLVAVISIEKDIYKYYSTSFKIIINELDFTTEGDSGEESGSGGGGSGGGSGGGGSGSDGSSGGCNDGDTRICSTNLQGICSTGIETCSGGSWGSCVANSPELEICSDGLDNDCDGAIDTLDGECITGLCITGTTSYCDTTLLGICSAGTRTCLSTNVWGNCEQDNTAQEESDAAGTCADVLDNDCDGDTDAADSGCQVCVEGDEQDCSTGLNGVCNEGTQVCQDTSTWGTCDQITFGSEESIGAGNCNDGIDNDCDGRKDANEPECQTASECNPGDTAYCPTGLYGICSAGTRTCGSNELWGECIQDQASSPENDATGNSCSDTLDNDCDGLVDEDDTDCTTLPPEPGTNNVTLENDNSFPVIDDYAYIPISFEEGEYTKSELDQIKLVHDNPSESLTTQIMPTSFYKTGNGAELWVRTGVAKVLVSLDAGEEKEYSIGEGTNTAFVMLPEVQTALTDDSIKAYVTDLFGGKYEVAFNINDPMTEILEDGPVTKVYKLEKNHRPVLGCNSLSSHANGCLSYMFSSTFIVTIISGQPHLKIDHFVANFGNLQEDTWTPGTPYRYTTGQNGFVFYDQIYLETNTQGQSNIYILDKNYLDPSYKQGLGPTHRRFMIMDSDAQQILSGGTYNERSPTSNYIAAGQGFLTRLTLTLGSTTTMAYDYFEENGISGGQKLYKWNRISDYFFNDVINPEAADPGYDWTADATSYFNDKKGTVSNNLYGHRFGLYTYPTKDIGAPGFSNMLRQEPTPVLKYLLSCQDKCKREYLDAMRFFIYGTTSLSEHGIGYIPSEHPEALPYSPIDAPLFETTANGGVIDCRVTIQAPDVLGVCSYDRNTDEMYREDIDGNSYQTEISGGRGEWHDWTGRDAAHFSMGTEGYRYMLSGDYMALELGRHTAANVVSSYEYFSTYYSHYQDSPRSLGRALSTASLMYTLTGEDYYKQGTRTILETIDRTRNKDDVSPYGNSPLTGDPLPVKYFASGGGCNTQPTTCKIQIFQTSIILQGIASAYFNVITDQADKDMIKGMLEDGYEFLYNYAYKDYSEVRNNVPSENGAITLFEGEGGHGLYNRVIYRPKPGFTTSQMTEYTQFDNREDPQLFDGWCNSLKALEDLNGAGWQGYKSIFADMFHKAYVVPDEVYAQGNGVRSYGVRFEYFDPEYPCGLHYSQDVPNADEANNCVDGDGDGYTTCTGDCNDNDQDIHPQGWNSPLCQNGIDNDCDGKIDCDSQACGWQGQNGGNPWGYCPSGSADGQGFCGDGIIQEPNAYGFIEECDVKINGGSSWGGENSCAGGTCIMPTISGVQGCVCAGSALATSPPKFFPAIIIQKIYDQLRDLSDKFSPTGNNIKDDSNSPQKQANNNQPTTTTSSTEKTSQKVTSTQTTGRSLFKKDFFKNIFS